MHCMTAVRVACDEGETVVALRADGAVADGALDGVADDAGAVSADRAPSATADATEGGE